MNPPFGTVAIIGVGLIGGSLGMALKEKHLARQVIGVGRDRERLETAIDLKAIDSAATDLQTGIADADVIVLATTISHIIASLPEVLEYAQRGAVLTDVGSTKTAIVDQAGSCSQFVGGHPMAGSEKGGVEAAQPRLFEGATWALTPRPHTSPDALQAIRQMAEAVGATPHIFTPEAHDAMVAVTSHVPHVMASALMRLASETARDLPATPRLAAGSFADMTRIAASSPELWRDVCLSNRAAVLAALEGLQTEMDRLEAAVNSQDADAIEEFFQGGASAKKAWPPRPGSRS